MKTIHVVTSGEYSDYGIDAIFETKELAERYIASFKKSGWNKIRIEEWELNPNKVELKEGKKAYRVRIDKQGNATGIEWIDFAFEFKDRMWRGISFPHKKDLKKCYCFARDEKHAVKIAKKKYNSMKQKTNKLKQFKQWFLRFVMCRFGFHDWIADRDTITKCNRTCVRCDKWQHSMYDMVSNDIYWVDGKYW